MPGIIQTITKNQAALLSLGCIWIAMALLVMPSGDFPLIDDWSFARPVQSFLSQGTLQFTGWQDMTLIAQTLWGILFCLPFGFSFAALRVSTLCAGLLGIWATYLLLEETTSNKKFAFIGALLIAINPLYFVLSNTFMTDVPFYACTVAAFLFYARGIRLESARSILGGSACICIAAFIRQSALIVPCAFTLAYLCKYGMRKKSLLTALSPLMLLASIMLMYHFWLQPAFGLPAFYSTKIQKAAAFFQFPINVVYDKIELQAIRAAIYLGWFLSPILFLHLTHQWQYYSQKRRVGFVLLLLSTGLLLNHHRALAAALIPGMGNFLRHYGIDPVSTIGTVYLWHAYALPETLIALLAVAGIVGATLVFWNMLLALEKLVTMHTNDDLAKQWLTIFVILTTLLYFLPLTGVSFWDRYLIFLLPFLLLLLAKDKDRADYAKPGGRWYTTLFLLCMLCATTLGLTHDYLSWNAARWKALRYLTQEKNIPYTMIDGGFEFNGWSRKDAAFNTSGKNPGPWRVRDAQYLVSFGPIEGYKEIKSYTYQRWIPCVKATILILRKPLQ